MSLRISVISGYVSQVYVLILGMAIVPIYLRWMGAEAYGLIGFFTMLQAWFAMLDLGLSATASRETSLYKSQQVSAQDFSTLYAGLFWIFSAVATAGALVLLLAAPQISQRWLVFTELGLDQVIFCVQVMALCVALKLIGGIFRSVITGVEQLTWLNAFNVVVATLKLAGVLLSMWQWGFTSRVFFFHQLIVALLECGCLWWKARTFVPQGSMPPLTLALSTVWKKLRFMLSMAFVSVVWVMVSQLDKLVLSGVLTLHDYAYFSVAMVVANGITFLTGPVAAALMPRMTRLHAQAQDLALLEVYRRTTRLLMALIAPVAAVMAFYANEILFIWTGDHEIAGHAAPTLQLYAVGNGFLAMSGFAYYLQYAKGIMRYHVYSSVLFVVLLMPALIAAALYHGAAGAGWVWMGFNMLYLLFWVAFVHGKLAPGIHLDWMLRDGVEVALPSIILMAIVDHFFSFSDQRLSAFLELAVVSIAALALSMACVREVRGALTNRFKFNQAEGEH